MYQGVWFLVVLAPCIASILKFGFRFIIQTKISGIQIQIRGKVLDLDSNQESCFHADHIPVLCDQADLSQDLNSTLWKILHEGQYHSDWEKMWFGSYLKFTFYVGMGFTFSFNILLHPGCNSLGIVCVSACLSRSHSWTDRHTDLNFGM